MSSVNDGGPAFPNPGLLETSPHATMNGMSLRDYFAAKAMHGLLAQSVDDPGLFADDDVKMHTIDGFPTRKECRQRQLATLARDAYAIADAMLAARNGGGA